MKRLSNILLDMAIADWLNGNEPLMWATLFTRELLKHPDMQWRDFAKLLEEV